MKTLDKTTAAFYAVIVLIPLFMLGMWLTSAAWIREAETEVLGALGGVIRTVAAEEAGQDGTGQDGTGESGADALRQSVDALSRSWERHQKRLALFLHHDEINEIEFSVTQFRRAAEFGDYEAAVHNADRIRCLFKMLREHDEVNIGNLLCTG